MGTACYTDHDDIDDTDDDDDIIQYTRLVH